MRVRSRNDTHPHEHRTPTCTCALAHLTFSFTLYLSHKNRPSTPNTTRARRKTKSENSCASTRKVTPPPRPPYPPIFSLYLHTRALQLCVAPGCISMQNHKQANSWSCVADSTASTASILHRSRLPSLSSDALLFVLCCCSGVHTMPSLFGCID